MGNRTRAGFTTPIIRRWDELGYRKSYKIAQMNKPFDPRDPSTAIGGVLNYLVPSSELIPIIDKVPSDQLPFKHNEAPTFAEFVDIAKRVPTAIFEVYVVCEWRDDERVTIDGVRVPVPDGLVPNAKNLRQSRKETFGTLGNFDKPAREHFTTVDGKRYYRAWWD
nr:hypothetical protein [Candidatus Sigynarchaeum springense]